MKDLRIFLDQLIKEQPGSVKHVAEEVDPRFGITAYGARFAAEKRYPALLFTKVRGAQSACVTNVCATFDRMALALDTDADALRGPAGLGLEREEHAPVEVAREDAPVKEIVLHGDEVDLRRFPIPVHNELDGGPFLTAAVSVMRDPVSGRMNAGLYRHHVHDSRRMGVWFFGSHHGGTIYRRNEERGEPTPVALVIGHHPAFLMGAVSRVPGIGGEYEVAGAFMGEPLEVVAAETSNLLVPARAEIVLEGQVLPGEREEEGPFAEWPGHYVAGGPKPAIRIDCVTMRRGAIFQDIQASGREHRLMGALPRIASVYRSVGQAVPGLRAVHIPLHTRMHCYLSIRKEQDNDGIRAAFAALNTEPENFRAIVVVDDDIDVYDEEEVSWAVGTRFDAGRDLLVVPSWNGPGGLLPTNWDYDAAGGRTPRRSAAVIVDATKPAPPVQFPPRARVPEDAQAGVDLEAARDILRVSELPWNV